MHGDDDYWDDSIVDAFSFEEDDELTISEYDHPSSTTTGRNESYQPTTSNKSKELDSISNYISEKALKLILDSDNVEWEPTASKLPMEEELRLLRRQAKNKWETEEANKTIKSILVGYPYSLEQYKSLSSKKQLLNYAIAMGDGDAILSVVIFLVNTLKKNLLHQLLVNCPVAIAHYTQHLFVHRHLQQMNEFLEMLGRNKEIVMKQFGIACENRERLLQRLKLCAKSHIIDNSDKQFLDSFIMLVEWQTNGCNKELIGKSAVETLEYIVKKEKDGKNAKNDVDELVNKLGVTPKLALMASVRGNCEAKQWEEVQKLLIIKGWVGGEKLSTNLPMEKILLHLQSSGAPVELIDKLLDLLDMDSKIDVAIKLHKPIMVIDALVKKKDRQSLLQYLATLQSNTAEYLYGDNALRNVMNKWKN